MKPSEIRHELLEQHSQIRIMTEVVQTIAKGVRDGNGSSGELADCLARLSEAVGSHNWREEVLLRDLVPLIDAWGPARAAIMTEEHIQEHARLQTALRGISMTSPEIAAVGVLALTRLIREHMAREEAAFLCEEVLRDDIIVPAQSGG
jgi:hypothetical protein